MALIMIPRLLKRLCRELDRLNDELAELTFRPPVYRVVNPWDYAKPGRDGFLRKLGDSPRTFFLGMNPGPWGMAQTGVPFGEVGMVRDWMGLHPEVSPPENEHPKRPVEGMACSRREVSGRRFWGLMRDHYGSAADCLAEVAVWPFCPLMWLKESGANLPPNQLRVSERRPMEEMCDRSLAGVLDVLQPQHLVAIGQYAEVALARVCPEREVTRILHPSPASPAANQDWAGTVTRQLKDAGVW
jgi:single-strand selective monofunctional uracil DNA glycosylase